MAREAECATTGLQTGVPADKQHCEAVNTLKGIRANMPSGLVTYDDPLYLRNKEVQANPEAYVGAMNGIFSNCATTSATTEAQFELQTCDDWSEFITKMCVMGREIDIYRCEETISTIRSSACTYGQIVRVDAFTNYQCRKQAAKVNNYRCNRVLNVQCEPFTDGCDNGGIVPGSTQGDMRVWFGPVGGGVYALEFGVFADDYWSGNKTTGAVYDRSLTFAIAAKDDITQFTLANVAWDDYLLVKLNGHLVFLGPEAGDRLVLATATVDCDSGGDNGYRYLQTVYGVWTTAPSNPGSADYRACSGLWGNSPEQKTSWSRNPGVDLRPYLINGVNVLETRTIVGGAGESAIRIHARMACRRNCEDVWDNQCVSLEARSR
jgi:hypothetical protein